MIEIILTNFNVAKSFKKHYMLEIAKKDQNTKYGRICNSQKEIPQTVNEQDI